MTINTFLAWLNLSGLSQYKPKMKGKTSQKLKLLKGFMIISHKTPYTTPQTSANLRVR